MQQFDIRDNKQKQTRNAEQVTSYLNAVINDKLKNKTRQQVNNWILYNI